ncbi:unnamed protein product [Calypogeia fissa]
MAPPFQELPAQKEANINVYVRIRPLNNDELRAGEKSAVSVLKDGKTIQVVEQGAGYKLTTRTFQFDGCLGPLAEQDQVTERLKVHKLLDSVLEGFSATIMACGQTGSGKTYTMSGRDEGTHVRNSFGKIEPRRDDGLIARSVTYLFNAMDRRTSESGADKPYSMRASYFEIYNEQVNDLLRLDAPPREVRWSSKDGFYVENLLLVDCETLDDVFAVLDEGSRNRKVGSHEVNKDSSRSHCIMTLHIDSNCYVDDEQPITRYGRMLFVDLAGSERLKKSKSSGEMLRETGSINRSLFTLGKVISALSEGKRGDGMVPYRESMLTKLLMESLGGNSLALMIACVSPSASALDETLSTLHYGTCAKNIVNAPSVNIDARNKIVLELQMEIKRLKEENALLRSRLGMTSDQEPTAASTAGPEKKRDKSPKKTHIEQDAQPTASSKTGFSSPLPDKQMKALEKLLCKDGNFQQESVELASLPRSEKSGTEGRHTARSLPLSHPMRALSPYGVSDRVKSEELWINSVRNNINTNGLIGMYRGLGGGRCKGQQLSRRSRVSVDHLSSRAKIKTRSTGKYGSKGDDDFQGSITVNETAFQRLLKLSTPVDRDDIMTPPY